MAPADPDRQAADPEADGEPGDAADPHELADDEAEHDAQGDARRHGIADGVGAERDAGVGEGEDRDHDVAGPGGERGAEPFGDRDRGAQLELELVHLLGRSEEHTSEPQSLKRTPYAVY